MIRRITGRLDGATELAVEITPEGSGVTYEVLIPRYLAERLGEQLGQVVTLHTREHLEAQGQGTSFVPRVIGFETPTERAFFELLTTVKGLGVRKALRALANEPAWVAAAIVDKDAKRLRTLPEIGARLAETIIAELHGKVGAALSSDELGALNASSVELRPSASLPAAAQEAVSALVALGETRVVAERLVDRAMALVGDEGGADAIVAAAFRQRAG
ncbi:MAG: Holliday junction branch migration protein RuvA [Phycisphaerales bacterium]